MQELKKRLFLICLTLCCLTGSQVVIAQPKTLKFAVNSPGSPPFLYFDKFEKKYLGLIPDMLSEAVAKGELDIRYLDSNRTRSEQFLYEGKAQIFTSSREWLKQPNKVIHSDSILVHNSYLYSLIPFADDFSLENLNRMPICGRRSYTYPTMQMYFDRKQAVKIESTTHSGMVEMLAHGRCKAVIMHEYNALTWFKRADFAELEYFKSPQPVTTVDLRLFFSPELSKERDLVNQYIQRYKSTDKLKQSLAFHMRNLKELKLDE